MSDKEYDVLNSIACRLSETNTDCDVSVRFVDGELKVSIAPKGEFKGTEFIESPKKKYKNSKRKFSKAQQGKI